MSRVRGNEMFNKSNRESRYPDISHEVLSSLLLYQVKVSTNGMKVLAAKKVGYIYVVASVLMKARIDSGI